MTYKTILLHLNDERRAAGLLDAATSLAARQQAHLIGLFVMPPLPAYGALSIGSGIVKSGLALFRDEALRVRSLFEEACRARSIAAEWRLIDDVQVPVASVVMDHGRSCDLIMVSQRDRGWDFTQLMEEPELVAIESGRPVLIIPHAGRFPNFGQRVTVAWNGRREAARAVFDALPLLTAAERVKVIWVNPQKEQALAGDVPTAEICAALARHGVKCEAATAQAPDISVGNILLSGLTDDSSDLLVMGAYGHTRLREFVFGGATREILQHMTAPVLMSH
jgi:nucleotide-binding universal stress UspA family protein